MHVTRYHRAGMHPRINYVGINGNNYYWKEGKNYFFCWNLYLHDFVVRRGVQRVCQSMDRDGAFSN